MKPVEIVEITKKTPIYKDGVEANSIEVVQFKYHDGSNCGYHLISQKGIYQIGDKAVFIQPDFCLSDLHLFDTFTKPFNDPKKSKLGKQNRIRAVKFNFNFEGSTDPIYSFGVLLPLNVVYDFVSSNKSISREEFLFESTNPESNWLQDMLGIIKYEEPESAGSGLVKGNFPSFLYKTDEENAANRVDHINKVLDNGEEIGLTLKRDGSSWTEYHKKEDRIFMHGICSRGMEKKLDQSQVTFYKDTDGKIYHPYFNQEKHEYGWYCDELLRYITQLEAEQLEPITELVKDSWIEVAKLGGYTDKLSKYCIDNDVELVFRGELCGQGLKGSGNKNNPDSNNKQQIILFGVDSLESGFSVRQHYGNTHNLKKIGDKLGLPYTENIDIINGGSYDTIKAKCAEIFESEKQAGRIVEGIVARTLYSNNLSVKFMNPEYDSKK